MSTPKRYIQVLNPSTCEGDLIWKQGLCRCISVQTKTRGLGQALHPMTDVLIRRMKLGDTEIQNHKGEGHMLMQAETGVT